MTQLSDENLKGYFEALPGWSHEIVLPRGLKTSSAKTQEFMAAEWEAMRLPPLEGRSVLDIGGFDGGYAFMAEEHGAGRVAVLDSYQWSLDRVAITEYHHRYADRGEAPPMPHHETEHWHPDELPGKRNFDLARQLRRSRVEGLPLDFSATSAEAIGTWDIVLFLGVLYHLKDPLTALERLRQVTRERAVIETHAMIVPGHPEPLWRLFPRAELNYDWTNWWIPNLGGLLGGLTAAGFSNSEVLIGEPEGLEGPGPHAYRLMVAAIP